ERGRLDPMRPTGDLLIRRDAPSRRGEAVNKKLGMLAPMILLLALTATPAAAASASNKTTQCHSGDILTGTYQNVIVAKDNYCLLLGATVLGNVNADKAVQLGIDSSTVGHDVHVNN